jgi:uncharacterized membrane protein SpoIIM required for sporulation
MKREPFVAAREARWIRLEDLLAQLRSVRRNAAPKDVAELPAAYRRVCQDLALARRRMYGRELTERLNRLALAGREQLYRLPARFAQRAIDFIAAEFPRKVREEARLFWLATAAFLVPALAVAAIALTRPDLLYALVDAEQLHEAERMYDPANGGVTELRDAGGNVKMFAFYIYNNVGIDFRTFAGGFLFGVGSLAVLVFNGIHLGAIVGHFLHIGYETTLLPFVVGHSSLELTAMLIAGVAGLRLGSALLAPGRRSRGRAMVEVAPHCLQLLVGAGGMTALAAFIEGFWSAQPLPDSVKYAVGAVLWSAVATYFVFAGRRRAA